MTRTGTLLLLTLAMACPASAHTVVIEGGKVHLRGELVNGGCAVAPDSQNMRIDMGQYRTNSFSGVGSFSTVNVPFTVRMFRAPWGSSFRASHPQRIRRSFWRHRDQVKRLSAAASGWRSLTNSNVRLSRMPRPSAGCRSIPASWRSILAPAIGLFPNTSSQAKFSRMSGLR